MDFKILDKYVDRLNKHEPKVVIKVDLESPFAKAIIKTLHGDREMTSFDISNNTGLKLNHIYKVLRNLTTVGKLTYRLIPGPNVKPLRLYRLKEQK